MGCGCKQNQNTKPKNEITPVPIPPSPVEPNYTTEELDRVESFLLSFPKNDTEKQFFKDFMFRVYQQVIPDYCDTVCLNTSKNRVNDLRVKYQMYQEYLRTKKTD